ncbi:MAG: hypothetical protein IPL77_11010 [Flavobacteriales bacterium]|nr:hypothetical protein [Flavobacteriales bacterium]
MTADAEARRLMDDTVDSFFSGLTYADRLCRLAHAAARARALRKKHWESYLGVLSVLATKYGPAPSYEDAVAAAKDNRYLVVVTLLGRRSVTEAGNKLVQTYKLAWEAETVFAPEQPTALYVRPGRKVFTGRVIATCGLSVRFESMDDGVDDAAAVSQIQKALAASDHAGQRFERLADAARAELTRVIAGEP